MASSEDSYSSDDSYIAWDGARYPGSPPAGWYLAVDNRWWPPQEVIDEGVPEMQSPAESLAVPKQTIPTIGKVIVDDHADDGATHSSDRTVRPEVARPAAGPTQPLEAPVTTPEVERPTPTADWAPNTSNTQPPAEKGPQPPNAPPPQRRRGRGRRRSGHPLRIVFVIAALLLFRNCNGILDTDADQASDFSVEAAETTVATFPPITTPERPVPTIVNAEDGGAATSAPTKALSETDSIAVVLGPNNIEVLARCKSGLLTTQVLAPEEPAAYTIRFNLRTDVDGEPVADPVEVQLVFPDEETGGFIAVGSHDIGPGLCAIDSAELLSP